MQIILTAVLWKLTLNKYQSDGSVSVTGKKCDVAVRVTGTKWRPCQCYRAQRDQSVSLCHKVRHSMRHLKVVPGDMGHCVSWGTPSMYGVPSMWSPCQWTVVVSVISSLLTSTTTSSPSHTCGRWSKKGAQHCPLHSPAGGELRRRHHLVPHTHTLRWRGAGVTGCGNGQYVVAMWWWPICCRHVVMTNMLSPCGDGQHVFAMWWWPYVVAMWWWPICYRHVVMANMLSRLSPCGDDQYVVAM